jgi:hypothetical protein
MGNPYFDSASANIDQAKLASLQAVAQAGTAGKQAYQQAQDSINADKQAAMARAATRAATLGVGGNDQTFGGAYDARLGQLATNRAGFEGGLAQTQASSDSYLEKARSSLPLLQAINTNKANAQEAAIKAAIALAQQKAQAAADAAAAKEAAAEKRAQTAADRADARAQKSADRADARSAKTAAAKDPTFDRLIAAGKLEVGASPLNKARLDTGNILGAVTENPDVRMARLAGQDMGYSPLQIGTALNQAKTNTYIKGQTPAPTPDEKWLTSNVRGMDTTKARQVLAAPEFQQAGTIADQFGSSAVDETGLITESGPYAGLTPRAAFEKWMRSVPGTLTMKNAAIQYYGGYLDQMSKK